MAKKQTEKMVRVLYVDHNPEHTIIPDVVQIYDVPVSFIEKHLINEYVEDHKAIFEAAQSVIEGKRVLDLNYAPPPEDIGQFTLVKEIKVSSDVTFILRCGRASYGLNELWVQEHGGCMDFDDQVFYGMVKVLALEYNIQIAFHTYL